MPLNKKLLSERDICTKYITPALEAAGWNKHTQLLEEVSFTDGKIYVRGKLAARGKGKRADYILYYKPNIPIAIIEAKDNTHSVRAGIQQALDYARILDIPCVFSSNGDGFLFHDRSAAPFVIAEGDLQSHEGSHAVSRFVIAEGHLCVTHDSTLDAEVVFDDDKKSDKSGVNKSDVYRDIERELSLDEFPSPAELWEKYKSYKGIATSLKNYARQLLTGQ